MAAAPSAQNSLPLINNEAGNDGLDESIHSVEFENRINAVGFKNTNDMNLTIAVGSMIMDKDSNKVEIFQLTETTTTSKE